MNIKNMLIIFYILLISSCIQYNIKSNFKNMNDIINKEIFIYSDDDLQSLTIVLEDGEYYLYKKFYLDGDKHANTVKYGPANFNQTIMFFNGVISVENYLGHPFQVVGSDERFKIIYNKNKLLVTLNGLELRIKSIK